MYLGAAKQNFATKDITKEMLEKELSTWFGNSRDRGEGGRKPKGKNATEANNVVQVPDGAATNVEQ